MIPESSSELFLGIIWDDYSEWSFQIIPTGSQVLFGIVISNNHSEWLFWIYIPDSCLQELSQGDIRKSSFKQLSGRIIPDHCAQQLFRRVLKNS